MTSRLLRTGAALLLAAAAVAYMVHALRQAPAALTGVAWTAHPWFLAGGIALQAAVLAVGILFWWFVLDRVAPGAIGAGRLVRIASLTSPTRYVPGRVWHVTSLGAMMRDAGVSVPAMLTSLAIHMWFSVLAALVVGAGLVTTLPIAAAMRTLVLLVVGAGVVAGVHPAVPRLVSRLLARVSREPSLGWTMRWGQGIALLAGYSLLNVATGVVACVILAATTGLGVAQAPRVIGANAIAFLAGYLSLVPAGLGVREAIMTMLLSTAAPAGVAAASAVILRASAVVADAVLAIAALAVGARRGKGSPVTGD